MNAEARNWIKRCTTHREDLDYAIDCMLQGDIDDLNEIGQMLITLFKDRDRWREQYLDLAEKGGV